MQKCHIQQTHCQETCFFLFVIYGIMNEIFMASSHRTTTTNDKNTEKNETKAEICS